MHKNRLRVPSTIHTPYKSERARDDLVSVDFRRDCAFRSGLEFSSCLHIFAFYYVVSKCIGSIYVYHQISGTHHQCIKVTNERKSKRIVCSAHETKETSFSVCRYGHQRLFFSFCPGAVLLVLFFSCHFSFSKTKRMRLVPFFAVFLFSVFFLDLFVCFHYELLYISLNSIWNQRFSPWPCVIIWKFDSGAKNLIVVAHKNPFKSSKILALIARALTTTPQLTLLFHTFFLLICVGPEFSI